MKNLKKELFYFIDFNIELIKKYEKLGFEVNIDDEVINYYSPVGNNDVPYPIAIGNENVYFMLDKKYVELSYFTNFKKIDFINAYGHYYGKLKKYSKNMKNIKKNIKIKNEKSFNYLEIN